MLDPCALPVRFALAPYVVVLIKVTHLPAYKTSWERIRTGMEHTPGQKIRDDP